VFSMAGAGAVPFVYDLEMRQPHGPKGFWTLVRPLVTSQGLASRCCSSFSSNADECNELR
jgi:hypothetical protein